MKQNWLAVLSVQVSFLAAAVSPAFGSDQPLPPSMPEKTISIAGEWRFKLDPREEGFGAEWFRATLPDRINLPGSCQQGGYGTKPAAAVGRLTPAHKYDGMAWYQRNIDVPPAWQGKRVEVFLERCLWESHAWLDDRPLGTQNSLSTPHLYSPGLLAPGRHVLTVCVDNRYKLPIGAWTHAITDDTQGRWNGLIGRLELRATDPVWVYSLQAYPDVERSAVTIRGQFGNATGQEGTGLLRLRLLFKGEYPQAPKEQTTPVHWTAAGGTFEAELPMSLAGIPVEPWDEFTPRLYQAEVALDGGETPTRVSFGFRQLAQRDRQITLNGRAVLLRGPVDECVYPLTGYPPMDKAAWWRVLEICQSYGFNHLRFHSWCPPEAAFEAGDELGFLFQVEAPLWTMDAPLFGKLPPRDQFIRDELDRILDTFGNHPSFALMAMGNESGGALDTLVTQGRARDLRHLYRCEHGGDAAHGDYVEAGRRGVYGPRTDWNRWATGGGWIAGESGNQPAAATAMPTVLHEAGQWAMYPDFGEIKKYTGVMRPENFEAYRRSLQGVGMLDQNAAFARASGALSVLLYKEEIEGSLRTWPLGGFQILEARDYPGQGTALVGWLDAFWDSKGLIAPEQFRRFCAPTVCLLRLPKRVWTTADTFEAQAEVSNYGPQPLESETDWSLTDAQGREIARGTLPSRRLETGHVTVTGMIHVPLANVPAPARLTVRVGLAQERTTENTWNIWVYPAQLPPAPVAVQPVRVVHAFDADTRSALAAGGRVLLFASPKELGNAVPGSFMPVFWCARLFKQTGTMGILCDPGHPALAGFPTEAHSDWQWADLLGRFSAADSLRVAGAPPSVYQPMNDAARDVSGRSKAVILDRTPPGYRPIVQVIDNYDRNHKLGALAALALAGAPLPRCRSRPLASSTRRPVERSGSRPQRIAHSPASPASTCLDGGASGRSRTARRRTTSTPS